MGSDGDSWSTKPTTATLCWLLVLVMVMCGCENDGDCDGE